MPNDFLLKLKFKFTLFPDGIKIYIKKKKKTEAQLEIRYTMKLFLMSVLCRLFNAKNLHVLKKTKY